LVVADIATQERVISDLQNLFDNTTAVDRRKKPSHGYRAFHLVVKYGDKLVEIQIRTSLQHLWAELSEKLSDTIDPALKYGGGDPSFLQLLGKASNIVARQESNDLELVKLQALLSLRLKQDPLTEDTQKLLAKLNDLNKEIESTGLEVFKALRGAINTLPTPRKQ
jgi:ppGpp synthetase/RelA/SpoT-type nucleotidyltranferase